MKFAVLVFPGTSGNVDSYKAIESTIGQPVDYVWHTATNLSEYDCIILPGGASYGNYLRGGAMAKLTPVMSEVAKAAEAGKLVLGISNGFQILLEAGLLPGTMFRNRTLKFHCGQMTVRVENSATPFTSEYEAGETVRLPIAHGEGNYYCDSATLEALKRNNQIVFRYADGSPDGSMDDIAGICNERGNVLGMMPYPDRAVHSLLGSEDGKRIFTSIWNGWREQHGAAVIG